MDMTTEQIRDEFRRQARLCKGAGLPHMLAILMDEFQVERLDELPERITEASLTEWEDNR